jgi:hypothetical protein
LRCIHRTLSTVHTVGTKPTVSVLGALTAVVAVTVCGEMTRVSTSFQFWRGKRGRRWAWPDRAAAPAVAAHELELITRECAYDLRAFTVKSAGRLQANVVIWWIGWRRQLRRWWKGWRCTRSTHRSFSTVFTVASESTKRVFGARPAIVAVAIGSG